MAKRVNLGPAYLRVAEILNQKRDQQGDFNLDIGWHFVEVGHEVVKHLVDFHQYFDLSLVDLKARPQASEQVAHSNRLMQVLRKQRSAALALYYDCQCLQSLEL